MSYTTSINIDITSPTDDDLITISGIITGIESTSDKWYFHDTHEDKTFYNPKIDALDDSARDDIITIIDKLNALNEDISNPIYDVNNVVERLTYTTLATELYNKYNGIILHSTFFTDEQQKNIKTTVLFSNGIYDNIRQNIRLNAFKLNKLIIDTNLNNLFK